MEDPREALVKFYCEINHVREDVAEYWIDQMSDGEVAEELRLRRGNG